MPSYSKQKPQSCSTFRDKYPYDGSYELLATKLGIGEYENFSKSELTRNKKEADGFRKPSPYSLTKSIRGAISGTFYYSVNSGRQDRLKFEGNLSAGLNFNYADATLAPPGLNHKSRTEIKALLRVKDQRMHYGIFLAELTEGVITIGTTFERVALAYKAVKRKNYKQAASYLGVSLPNPVRKKMGKGVSNDWLALQYGWLPLLSDVYNIYEDLRQGTLFRPIRFSTTASILDRVNEYQPFITAGGDFGQKAFKRSKGFKVVKVNLTYEFNNKTLITMSQSGLLNPAEVAWELVPFSFVIDWAVPVGDWISALSADTGLVFRGGSCTSFVKNAVTVSLGGGSNRSFTSKTDGLCEAHASYVRMERTVYSSSPWPIPYVKNPFSTKHLLNATALLRSIF